MMYYFFNYDIFNFAPNIANKDFDFVEFRATRICCYNDRIEEMKESFDWNEYYKGKIVVDLKLSAWIINVNGRNLPQDATMLMGCVNLIVCKETVYRLGSGKCFIFVRWAEGVVVNFVAFNISYSFTFIHK